MTLQWPNKLIFSTGTTALALVLATGVSASVAAPVLEPAGSSSPSVAQSNLASPTPVPGGAGSSAEKDAKSLTDSGSAPQDGSGSGVSPAEGGTEQGKTVEGAPVPGPSHSVVSTAPAEDSSHPGGATGQVQGDGRTQGAAKGVTLKVQAGSLAAKPGESYAGAVEGVPGGTHVSVSLVPADGLKADPVSCAVAGQAPSQTFECAVPKGQLHGEYTLNVRLLDKNNQPVIADGTEVADTSYNVMVAEPSKEYNPQIVAQYPVTAAGYIMPIAGGGYEPYSEVTMRGLDAAGKPVSGVTFAARPSGSVPSVAELDAAESTLTVTTDANGFFSAYLMTSPYMTSTTVSVVAQDQKTQASAWDRVDILGDSATRLNTSVGTIVAGEDVTVEISGDQFAPSYKNYPVTLQLVRDGQVVASQDVELLPPSGEGLWSSFEKTTLTQTASLKAGEYSLQAIVPHQVSIPAEFRGRLLASKAFTVTSPDALPAATATPTPSAQSAKPAKPAQTTQPAKTVVPLPGGLVKVGVTAFREPRVSALKPVESGGEYPQSIFAPLSSGNPWIIPGLGNALSAENLVLPVIKQMLAPQTTERTISQNPAWVQTSSIKADDPRVIHEPNQHLKSSVLNAQGTKSVQGSIDSQSLADAPDGVSSVSDTATLVNLNKPSSMWPVLVLVLVALGVGIVTGASISKTTSRAADSKK